MTDHPEDSTLDELRRLAELRVDRFEDSEASRISLLESFPSDLRAVIDPEYALAELRAARALLADLKAEGCPTDERGRCIWCCGEPVEEPGDEPRYHHRPMEDGKPCLWVRIEGA